MPASDAATIVAPRDHTAGLLEGAARLISVRSALISIAIAFILLMLVLPVLAVAAEALREGLGPVWRAVTSPYALSAFALSAGVVAVALVVNTLFGLAAAWAITKHRFPGRAILLTLIDLPFSVSPVIAGMIFVLLYGANGLLGPQLDGWGLRIIFAWPGIVLATLFVTFPFVARELIPLMQAQGREEEEAAASLGASGWSIFFRVTLPNVRWALAYGMVLCAARALGEFGAVSVVSGHVRGRTNTAPLEIEDLYNESRFVAAFAIASVMILATFGIIVIKSLLSHRVERHFPLTGVGRPIHD
jgi:sulfate transport system permease protein